MSPGRTKTQIILSNDNFLIYYLNAYVYLCSDFMKPTCLGIKQMKMSRTPRFFLCFFFFFVFFIRFWFSYFVFLMFQQQRQKYCKTRECWKLDKKNGSSIKAISEIQTIIEIMLHQKKNQIITAIMKYFQQFSGYIITLQQPGNSLAIILLLSDRAC